MGKYAIETTDQPFLSVIVPCWRASRYLYDLLQNFLEQASYNTKGIEFILVDDWSGDHPEAIINEFAEKMDIVYIHSHEEWKRCPGNCRQAGLDIANGKWVMFVDQDDLLDNCMFDAIRLADANIGHDDQYAIMQFGMDQEINGRIADKNFSEQRNSMGWLHGKVYRRAYLIEHGIKFKKDLLGQEDIYFNQLFFVYFYIIDAGKKKELKTQDDIVYYRWRRFESSTSYNACKYMTEHFIDGLYAVGNIAAETVSMCDNDGIDILYKMYVSSYVLTYSYWCFIRVTCPEYLQKLDSFLREIEVEVLSTLRIFGKTVDEFLDYLAANEQKLLDSEVCLKRYWVGEMHPVDLPEFGKWVFKNPQLSIVIYGKPATGTEMNPISGYDEFGFLGETELIMPYINTSVSTDVLMQLHPNRNVRVVDCGGDNDISDMSKYIRGKWAMFVRFDEFFCQDAGQSLWILLNNDEVRTMHQDIAVWTNCQIDGKRLDAPRTTLSGHLYSWQYIVEHGFDKYLHDAEKFNNAVIGSIDGEACYFNNQPLLIERQECS